MFVVLGVATGGCGSEGSQPQGQSAGVVETLPDGSTSAPTSDESSTGTVGPTGTRTGDEPTLGIESEPSPTGTTVLATDEPSSAPLVSTADPDPIETGADGGEVTSAEPVQSALLPVCAWEYRTAEGVLERRWEMGYDDNGFVNFRGIDDNGDGAFDTIERWTNDVRGNQLTREVDREGDGVTDRKEFSQYDEHNNLVRFESDENMDGTMDRLDLFTYDDSQRILTTVYDRQGDGLEVDRLDYTYEDTDGGLLQTELLDWGVDGVIDRQTLRLYDADGHLLDEQWDDEADGTLESHVSYEYDARGNKLAERSDFRTLEYEYDAQDRLVLETEWRDDDSIALIKTYEYTAESGGSRVDIYVDYDGDGGRDYAEAEHYDAVGNLLYHEVDSGADGTIDLVRTIFFECN